MWLLEFDDQRPTWRPKVAPAGTRRGPASYQAGPRWHARCVTGSSPRNAALLLGKQPTRQPASLNRNSAPRAWWLSARWPGALGSIPGPTSISRSTGLPRPPSGEHGALWIGWPVRLNLIWCQPRQPRTACAQRSRRTVWRCDRPVSGVARYTPGRSAAGNRDPLGRILQVPDENQDRAAWAMLTRRARPASAAIVVSRLHCLPGVCPVERFRRAGTPRFHRRYP